MKIKLLGSFIGLLGLIALYFSIGAFGAIGVFLMAFGHNLEKEHGE